MQSWKRPGDCTTSEARAVSGASKPNENLIPEKVYSSPIEKLEAAAFCDPGRFGWIIPLDKAIAIVRQHRPEPVPLEKCVAAMRRAPVSRVVTFQKIEQTGAEPVITNEKIEYVVTDEEKAKAVLTAAGVKWEE